MKAKIRIPTSDQFAFVEFEVDDLGFDEISEVYQAEYKRYHNGNGGLPTKEWNAMLDKYLEEGISSSEEYTLLSKEQQNIIQEIKKSCKRINYKSKLMPEGEQIV